MSWGGEKSLSFGSLDPFYIEICRRTRLTLDHKQAVFAKTTGSDVPRIDSKARNGITGDVWTPVARSEGKALSITARGFDYQLASDLLFGSVFQQSRAQTPVQQDGQDGLVVLAQSVTRGKGKTEGYHERSIPISPKVRQLLLLKQRDLLAKVATDRVYAIKQMRSVLWSALAALFDKGSVKDKFSDSAKNKASDFSKPFEQAEDARFFIALNEEMESEQPDNERLQWLLSMADAAEAVLKHAFTAGPQCGEQRYRAQAAALARFHSGLRNPKTLPALANHLRQQSIEKEVP